MRSRFALENAANLRPTGARSAEISELRHLRAGGAREVGVQDGILAQKISRPEGRFWRFTCVRSARFGMRSRFMLENVADARFGNVAPDAGQRASCARRAAQAAEMLGQTPTTGILDARITTSEASLPARSAGDASISEYGCARWRGEEITVGSQGIRRISCIVCSPEYNGQHLRRPGGDRACAVAGRPTLRGWPLAAKSLEGFAQMLCSQALIALHFGRRRISEQVRDR